MASQSTTDNDDVEIELKHAHVNMYVLKLREKQRCKHIARDCNLVLAFLEKAREKTAKRKLTEEPELRLKLRPLCQFMSCKVFNNLFEIMPKEKMLRAKIRELQRCKWNGITHQDGVVGQVQGSLALAGEVEGELGLSRHQVRVGGRQGR